MVNAALTAFYTVLILHKKFLYFHWLRAVQFLGDTVPNWLRFSYDSCIFIACVHVSLTLVFAITIRCKHVQVLLK